MKVLHGFLVVMIGSWTWGIGSPANAKSIKYEAVCECAGPPECDGGTHDSSVDKGLRFAKPDTATPAQLQKKAESECERNFSCRPRAKDGERYECAWTSFSYRLLGEDPVEEIEDKKNCEVPEGYQLKAGALVHIRETDLPGMRVWHLTSSVDVSSVKSGPKNLGDGLSGPGLYLALFDESGAHLEVAGTSANVSVIQRGGEEAILSGIINPKADACVISLQTTRTETDLSIGWIGGYWERKARQPEMVPWIMGIEIMDLRPVELEEGMGGAALNQRILVIHESAGSDIIKWDP